MSRLARPAQIHCNLVKVGPKVQHSSCELRNIVHTNRIRFSSLHGNLLKYLHHLVCIESTVHPDCYRFTGANIQTGQDPDTLSICERVTHKVHGPDLIGRQTEPRGGFPGSGKTPSFKVSFSSWKALPGDIVDAPAWDSPSILPCEAGHAIFDIRIESCWLQGPLTSCEAVPVDLCDFCSNPWSWRIASHDISCAGLSHSVSCIQLPVRTPRVDLELFWQDILQQLLVEAQVGYQLLQLPILFLQNPEASYLLIAHGTLFCFPPKEGGLANAKLAKDIFDRQSGFRLPQRKSNLFLWETFATHGFNPFR